MPTQKKRSLLGCNFFSLDLVGAMVGSDRLYLLGSDGKSVVSFSVNIVLKLHLGEVVLQ
ncbi:MAG: hypothetical protein V7K97_04455 [Nostoc sp.]